MRQLSIGFLVAVLSCATDARAAQWLWVEHEPPTQTVRFSRTFRVPAKAERVELRAVADHAALTVTLNDARVAWSPPCGAMIKADVTQHVREGENTITLHALPVEGPTAVAARLRVTPVDGEPFDVATDDRWRGTINKRNAKVRTRGDLAAESWWDLPSIEIDELDDYTQWKRAIKAERGTDPATFMTLPGYEVEMLRSAGADEGSWISLAFDPEGRIAIGREDKGVMRYALDGPGGTIAKAETLDDTLREVRGLLYAHDALYVSASESKAVFRLRDTTGDGAFDETIRLFDMPGGRGHGRNDLALGPDGMIYLISGDAVTLPEGVADRTSPHRRRFKPFRPNEGHVLRFDRDGERREIFCGGLRNPYGIAFNRDGEAFTYDADAEFDMGSPWYRPTRIVHLFAGADYGWRAVTNSWPPYYPDHPDNAPHAVHIGKGSPTGVKFGTRAAFPHPYRDALYALDWSYGRILAVHLTPNGAGYRGEPEVFLQGRPLNVTDLDFGPDGAMYFVTGGRKTRSALYRVRYTGDDEIDATPPSTAQQTARTQHGAKRRQLRRVVENDYHSASIERSQLWPLLDDPDPCIRYTARVAFEHRPADAWREITPFGLTGTTALINADPAAASNALESVLSMEVARLTALPTHQRLRAFNVIRMCLDRIDGEAAAAASVVAKLAPLYPAETRAENEALSAMLVRLGDASATAKTMALLRDETQQRQQMHYLFVLRTARDGWTDARRRAYFTRLGEARDYLGGRGLPQFVKRITDDALKTLDDAQADAMRKVVDAATKPPPMPNLAARKFVRNWTLKDLAPHLRMSDTLADRDLDNGRRMFDQALCSQCHRVGMRGRAIGPDLTHVAGRFGPRDLLVAIIEPSQVVAGNYRTDELVMKDGRTLVGQVIPQLDYRAGELLLAPDPLTPDKTITVLKADIVEHRKSDRSLMPPGLLNTLTADDILDLIAWLTHRKR